MEAKIFVPVTRPYSEQELAQMRPYEVADIKSGNMQKVVREDHVATIHTDNRQELKGKVLDLCMKHQPNPILVKLNTTLGRTFLVNATSSNDKNLLLVEDIYFTYNKKGKEIQQFMESKLAVSGEQVEKALAEIGWRLEDYVHAMYGGKSYDEEPTDREIEENLMLLDPHERSTVKQVWDTHKNTMPNLYAEVADKFGIRKQFRQEEGVYRDFEPYTTVARSIELRGQPLDLNSVLFDFVEERGRIITRIGGRADVDTASWLMEFHPEMMAKDINVTNNDMSDFSEVIEQS